MGPLSILPQEIIEAATSFLSRARYEGQIRDFLIYPLGRDLHLQVNTLGKGLHQKSVHKIIWEALHTAMLKAADVGFYRALGGEDYFAMSWPDRLKALHLRTVEFPFTERGSEPIYIAKLINGAVGSF